MTVNYLGATPSQATPRSRHLFERENLSAQDLMQVVLVVPSERKHSVVPSFSRGELGKLAMELRSLGIRQIKLFASEEIKGDALRRAASDDGALLDAVRAIKDADPDLYVAVETCLCPYTEFGECGAFGKNGELLVEETRQAFAAMAVRQAQAGVDAVGPASMIPGTIRACREALDQTAHSHVGVMPHMIFRSPFYGLYREVMNTAGSGANRSRLPFHLDANDRQPAMTRAHQFLAEGADSILMEPGLFILDAVRDVASTAKVPVGCFSVSGEYRLLKEHNEDVSRVAQLEFCRSARRAGARFIATYGARDIARALELPHAP